MSEKAREKSSVYEFGPFVLNVREHLLTKGKVPVSLPPKAFDLLLVLVESSGSLLRKEDLFELVWPGESVEEGNIPYNIALVRKALGDSAAGPVYIATVSKQGYRFIAAVKCKPAPERSPIKSESGSVDNRADEESLVQHADVDTVTAVPGANGKVHSQSQLDYSPLKRHLPHLLGACILYALYYPVAFILEIAYQYESYGSRALKFTPLIFFWILITSLVGLETGLKWTVKGSSFGLLLSVSVFVIAALLLYFAAGLFLPNTAITEASFQTYPAQGAFLKNIYCVLPLVALFLVLPSHYIVAAESGVIVRDWPGQLGLRDRIRFTAMQPGAIYLKTSWLVAIFVGTFLLAFVGSAHLFENLKPNPNMGLFIQLNQWRLLLYFLLGFECVLWYQHVQGGDGSDRKLMSVMRGQ